MEIIKPTKKISVKHYGLATGQIVSVRHIRRIRIEVRDED